MTHPTPPVEAPPDALASDLEAFSALDEGWDGEAAAAPSPASVADALGLVRLLGARACGMEASLHVDGSVVLDDGTVSLSFPGGGRVVVVGRDGAGQADLDGVSVPPSVARALMAPETSDRAS